jgi:hypothetical protein
LLKTLLLQYNLIFFSMARQGNARTPRYFSRFLTIHLLKSDLHKSLDGS